MALTIYPSQAYALLAGLFIGKFTNLFSDAVITGLVLYIVTPEIFTEERLDKCKNYFWSWFKFGEYQTIKVSDLTDEQKALLANHIKTENNHKLIEQSQTITSSGMSMLDFAKLPKIEVVTSPQPVFLKTK